MMVGCREQNTTENAFPGGAERRGKRLSECFLRLMLEAHPVHLSIISETPDSGRGEFLVVSVDKNGNMVGSDGCTGPPY